MDQAKVAFLFGEPPEWADPDSSEDRALLLSQQFEDSDEMAPAGLALYEVVANQVTNDDPPEVWQTAQRLLGLGLDRQRVLSELAMATSTQVMAAVSDHEKYDLAAHRAALAALPLPTVEEVVDVLRSVAREQQPVRIRDLLASAKAALDIPPEQEPHFSFIENVFDQAVDEEDLAVVRGDLVVEPISLFARTVLTHRLTAEEREGGYLETEVDLVTTEEVDAVYGPGGVELEDFWRQDVGMVWKGPAGWLSPFVVGTVFATRTNEDGTAAFVETFATAPEPEDATVMAVRAAYDEYIDEISLPMTTKELTLALLAKDRHFFDEPRAPLRQLVAAAGLQRRDNEVVHSPEIWRRADEMEQYQRVISSFEHPEEADDALSVLSVFNDGDWQDGKRLRAALGILRDDPDAAEVVARELLGPELEESTEISAQAALASRFAERLLAVARKPAEVAVARWLMALADERVGDVFGAEAHLRVAVGVSGEWEPAVDRLAWYLSDKGEADEAARLWRSLGVDETDARLTELAAGAGPSGSTPGRNDPCWCGSGRKYKACHLGKPALAPLPERVRWLAGKSVNYLKRIGPAAAPAILTVAVARAGGDTSPEAIGKALSDPLTLDLVLNEGGWFEKFLDARGPLLPADEALLATSWALVDRSVYELLSVRPGQGVIVKDLRTAEEIDVRERTFSQRASAGTMICARVVPDGEGHQLLGGLFFVRAGTEAALLDLLDEGDPDAIAGWAAALDRPPVIVTRENEPTVMCKAVVEVPDELQARQVLDRHYRPSGAGRWEEMFEIGPEEEILRATLVLAGSRLTIEANSEERMERVIGVLKKDMPELAVLADERQPLDLSKAREPTSPRMAGADEETGSTGSGAADELINLPPELREEIQEKFERRWCDDHVPALGGMTPREAAADPTRRETLERLLVEFEVRNRRQPEGAIVMRPSRLREMLGLT